MSVIVVLEIKAKPDKVDDIKKLLRDVIPDTRAYDGFESLTFHQDQDDPTSFLMWEQWTTRPKYDTYLAWRTETGALNSLVEMLTGPPSFRFFDFVGL